eukprot:scaffold22078_cov33-Tisochrysis_lutea.AAC.8
MLRVGRKLVRIEPVVISWEVLVDSCGRHLCLCRAMEKVGDGCFRQHEKPQHHNPDFATPALTAATPGF